MLSQEWLCDVERAMRWTLREVLRNCRMALKKMLTKRDKWVKEWPGQVRTQSRAGTSYGVSEVSWQVPRG